MVPPRRRRSPRRHREHGAGARRPPHRLRRPARRDGRQLGGGYGALLFGHLLHADVVLAFSPRSFVGWRQRVRHRDFRRWRELAALGRTGGPDPAFDDLVALIGDAPGFGHADLHYSTGDRVDVLHAERLGAVPGVTLHPHAAGGHDLVVGLRADARLTTLLRDACLGRHVRRA